MVVLDVIGRRWALRILWELRNGPLTFRALASASGGLSPSTLNTRLGELQGLDIIEHRADEGYALSAAGEELAAILLALSRWADKHIR